jgi:transposase
VGRGVGPDAARQSPVARARPAPARDGPRSVPAVGPTVSLTRLAHLPELGHGAVKHIATLLGLAPLNRARGTWRGTRASWGGRRQVRAVRYLAALTGVRHNPVLRAFSAQLLARFLRAAARARQTQAAGPDRL